MGKLYAYARVSSQSQRLDRQIRNILNYLGEDRALTKLFKEKYTGTKLDRPEFQKLLKILKPGDTVIFDSVSRMSRNAEEGFQLYMELLEMGINLSLLMSRTLIPIITKRCRQKRLPLQNPGRESVDNLIQSVLTAITEFQKAETKEKIRVAFEQAEKELQICTNGSHRESRRRKRKISCYRQRNKSRSKGERVFRSGQKISGNEEPDRKDVKVLFR